MENLGAMAYSQYTGFREITDRDVLELHCIYIKILCKYFAKVAHIFIVFAHKNISVFKISLTLEPHIN